MIALTPTLLVAAASSFVGLREDGGDNRGLMIELFLRGVSMDPGQPWCAAFVHHVGYWSHFDYEARRSIWPLPATASCYSLGVFARNAKVLVQTPQAGDVFLHWSAERARFHHTGVVAWVQQNGNAPGDDMCDTWFDCDTIEGNTNDNGSANGVAVLRRTRRFYPAVGDRFIRWTDLQGYAPSLTDVRVRRAA